MQFTEHESTITINVSVTASSLTFEHVQQSLHDAGYSRFYLLKAQLDNLLAEYHQLQQKVIAGTLADAAKSLSYPIAEKRAAQLVFEIAEDKMTAVAFITAAWGGAPIAANALVKAAQEAGIVFGFNKENIVRLVQDASRAEPGIRLREEVAYGRVAVNGVNSRFIPMLPDMVIRRNQPLVDSESKADLRDFGVIPSVAAGTPLMQRLPPTQGEPGFTVTGERQPPVPGVIIEWQLGAGVELAADDPDMLLAQQDGLPRAIENGATVDDVFTVNQVDLTSGHIIFKGSVVISGNVSAGMKVIAGGNVFIKGVVEGQLIEAGGDIVVGGAIIGHQVMTANQQEYSTVLKAKGNIHCNMAQYSALNCDGHIYASKYLMHCFVNAHAVLAGTEDKINGKVVGGHYYLAKSLHCGQLGSPSNGAVMIKLNRLLDPLVEQQALLRTQVSEAKDLLADLKQHIEGQKKLQTGQVDPQMQMFEIEFVEQQKLAKMLLAELRALEAKRQELLLTLEVKATQQVFSAVDIQFGHETVRSRREYGPSIAKIVDGHPSIEPL
ncbi:DUF342 domain-containing protein [Alishewanella tabrizica]|uniref:Flagellar Assembly Protein A N-terminal region domain-containing protein n=1 Tax=Alishewanella tabrizica TaxID=671278 RepID=A0ABQ2WDA7_9ALTE|nr:FapA family protein [Alishewanella tabrizica]GGW50415.1 hypothetical protein GCM10008111_02900 [Alishewanella tabrizica]